jgi:signal transduction histidine kinase
MRRLARPRLWYVGVAVVLGAAVYLIVELVFQLELVTAGPISQESPLGALAVHRWSLLLWLFVAGGTGFVAERFARGLAVAARDAERGREELALVAELSAALSGPLGPHEVAAQFLGAIGTLLPSGALATLLQYEEAGESVRILARRGAAGTPDHEMALPTAELPAALRTRIIGERRSYIVDDTGAEPDWPAFAAALPVVASARSFGALPLVSRSRLIGAVVVMHPRPDALERDRLQFVSLLGQYVAGALHNALSIAEADARAEREAVVNRISQRVYANLDPQGVVRSALEELGAELAASRLFIAVPAGGELTVLHEWHAPGVRPVGVGTRGGLPLSALAIREGRTIAVRDARIDPRLAEPHGGSNALVERGAIAAIATPIGLGGQLSGVLVLDHVGGPRAWTSQDVRLLETVARELRTALEAAQLLQARQRESERMLALHRASTLVASGGDPTEVLSEILRAASALLGRGGAALYRWDENAGVLRQAESVHAAAGTAPVLRPGEGVTGEAFLEQRPVIVNDYGTYANAASATMRATFTAALAVPLARAGARLGVLTVGSTQPGTIFDEDDARLLGLFGDHAVAALTTAELVEQQRVAVAQLERLNAAKSDFVSIVSHEFRTPLTGIQGFSELIRDEDLTPEEMKEYAADINTDAQRLNRMITEMLDLDRMESGRMTLRRVPTDLNALISAAAERLAANAPRHPVELHLDPALPALDLDPDKIEQVLLNLLSNAVKYSPQGGPIAVTTRIEGPMVHVFVRDRGLGIPPDSLEKVFDRYSRLESGATRYIQGTGLGLPISRQIVEMHGGRAWVESTVGEGSVFQFTLPLIAVASA